jgi:hypothetical protein
LKIWEPPFILNIQNLFLFLPIQLLSLFMRLLLN